MANTEAEYEQDLQNIRNAIYGKDVREAMADALDYVHDTSSISGLNLKMDKANPTGTGYISINGRPSSTPGAKSVSLGNNCWAGAQNSVAMGINCDAHYDTSVAIGYSLSSDAAAQAVFGKYNAVDEAAIFIVGNGSDSSHKANAFVVKRNGAIYAKNDFVLFTTDCKISMMREPNTTAGMYSVTLGQYNTASDTHAMAIGYQNAATAVESFAGGYGCQANHGQSFAFGVGCRTGASAQVAIGNYNSVDSGALFVVGNGTDSNNRSNAFVVKSNGSAAIGSGTEASDTLPYQFVCGKYNSEDSDALFIVGNGTGAARSNAFCITPGGAIVSNNSSITGSDSFITGNDCTVGGDNSMVIGSSCTANGNNSFVGGSDCYTDSSASDSFVFGDDNQAFGANNVLFGKGLRTYQDNGFLIGTYNDNSVVGNDPIFVIGNGTDDDNRSTAFVVKPNGDASFFINGSEVSVSDFITSKAVYTVDVDTTNGVDSPTATSSELISIHDKFTANEEARLKIKLYDENGLHPRYSIGYLMSNPYVKGYVFEFSSYDGNSKLKYYVDCTTGAISSTIPS